MSETFSQNIQVTDTSQIITEFYRANDYVHEESVCYLMKRLLILATQEIESELEPRGLTNAQWPPLIYLYIDQVSTVTKLARECELDVGAMTRLLDRLQAKGLCLRERSQDDRRVVKVELTDAGTDAAKVIPAILSQLQNAHLAGFSLEEFNTLKGFLHRMLDSAQPKINASNLKCK